jgi:hypothetical protein
LKKKSSRKVIEVETTTVRMEKTYVIRQDKEEAKEGDEKDSSSDEDFAPRVFEKR